MEIQLNLDAHQAIKNLTQAGIDEEQAVALVSTFGSFSEKIATKDDLAVVKQEMKAMDAKQSQRSDYLEKTLTQEMKAMETRQSQEMKAMETRQSQKSDYLEKTLTQRNDSLEKTLVGEIAKSRYIMFAVMVAAAAVVLTLHETLQRFLN